MAFDNPYLIAAAWIGLALLASLISIRLGISVALIEILVGVVAGNFSGLQSNVWIDFLAAFGATLLTFLAGAEIDPASLRRHLRISFAVGLVSFAAPFAAAFTFAYFVAGWTLQAAAICGIALSTTSVAVVYAVMIESGLAERELGKVILAACFITDLGTVVALGLLFANFNATLAIFVAVTAVVLLVLPRMLRLVVSRLSGRVSEPEVKLLFVVLFGLGGLAQLAGSEAVLPAYLAGLAVARAFRMPVREANYTTLLMSTGLTFGTISALYGFNHGYIDQAAYTVLVTVVILSAVVPTLIATTFFEPHALAAADAEEFDAAEEIDAGPLRRPA